MFEFKQARKLIEVIDTFLDTIEQGAIVFRDGVGNYLSKDDARFNGNIQKLSALEAEADNLKRQAETILYKRSLMPQLRGDILKLLEELDSIIDLAKANLYQFDVEIPFIPEELHPDLLKLTEISVSAIESVVPAARAWFKHPETVKEKLHKVYLYENEADKLADSIKRRVFHEMGQIKLSEKIHLRYFTLHLENLSDAAQKVADTLSIMAIIRTI
ncbi:MAG: DUF47 family protein [Bacteroidales bacterium]|jgi:hypothetical protein|nr:DUF47 family protein [Bacteroidales bacterium]NPV35962.1 DUF47 family protein [Bacteroidales bacterium]